MWRRLQGYEIARQAVTRGPLRPRGGVLDGAVAVRLVQGVDQATCPA